MAEATQLQMLGTVGGAATTGDGATAVVRLGADRSQAVTQTFARYQDRVLKGSVFIGSNLLGTPVTTQAGLSATLPALTLYNPAGSGVNAVLLAAQISVTASPAAAVGFCLAYNATTAGFYLGGTTGANAIDGVNLWTPLDGMIIVVPGCAVSVQASSAAAILACIAWDEVSTTVS